MPIISLQLIKMTMILLLFLNGILAFLPGIYILITRSAGRELHALTTQTSSLAQKGITEEIAGLVGNASALVEAINDLIKTNAGIGVFLTTLGVGLMGLAIYLTFNVELF